MTFCDSACDITEQTSHRHILVESTTLIIGASAAAHRCPTSYYTSHRRTVLSIQNLCTSDGFFDSSIWARENIIAGPYPLDPPILYVLRSRRPNRRKSRGRKRGDRCPLTIRLGVRGSVVSSPSKVPRPKMDFMHILGQKEANWNTIFRIFERRRGPPKVAGPGKTFPPPLSTGLSSKYCTGACLLQFLLVLRASRKGWPG